MVPHPLPHQLVLLGVPGLSGRPEWGPGPSWLQTPAMHLAYTGVLKEVELGIKTLERWKIKKENNNKQHPLVQNKSALHLKSKLWQGPEDPAPSQLSVVSLEYSVLNSLYQITLPLLCLKYNLLFPAPLSPHMHPHTLNPTTCPLHGQPFSAFRSYL